MFHIITCLEKGDNNEIIEKVLQEFLDMSDEMDALLECCTSPKRLLRHVEDIRDGENYLILIGDFVDDDYTLDLINTVRNKLKRCYILFASRNPRLLYTAVNRNTRLSGFLKSPLLDNTLLRLVKQAYRDYRDSNREDPDKLLVIYIVRGDVDSRERVMVRVPFEEIYFIEAFHRKTRYVLRTDVYSDNSTLAERELVLDRRFVRCHNAFIVNVEKIRMINYGKNEIHLKNGDVVPISRAKKKNLKEVLAELHMNVESGDGEEVPNVL